ncbi:FGGY family carbohydrate kinase [Brachybacterium sp. YJGR34]|uniref:FGGY family carbohydrate kinase n=1 Tax=Brachybacterium sp. YJGR34 TaxID=2059911 RepID=UPI000E0BB649|nr:FGGY family carbohydrate kinase [Brachybacterium sp. YJGR34]
MPGLLCLDLGTSSAKAALIDTGGHLLATASSAYPTRSTSDGGAEQDPADWVRAARAAIAPVLPASDGLAGLCLTGQMQDLVLEGPAGAAHPAVLYSDRRAGAEAEEIRARLARDGEDWEELTANHQDAGCCAAMFLRLARTDPAAIARAISITFGPAGHLAVVLGAGSWCDPTTAAATGLLEAGTRDWSGAVARAAGIDLALLPRLTTDAGQVVGRTGAGAGALLGLPAGVPIVLAPGDAGAATLGVTGLAAGRDHASLGTSGWIAGVRTADGSPAADGASHRLALAGGTTLHISALLAAGSAAAWARRTYLGGTDAAGADRLLEQREQEHGRGPTGLLALPSLGGERFPVRDEALRGAVLGLDASTGPVDLYAGMLEGIALALSHALEDRPAGDPLPVVGGGAASAPWRRILADVTGRPVLAVDGTDATLLGAALAGAEALGLDHRLAPLADQGGEPVEPDPSAAAAYRALRPAHRELYEAAARIGRRSEDGSSPRTAGVI